MKKNTLLTWLCVSTALCLLNSPLWAMRIEEDDLPGHTQKKKDLFFAEGEDTDMNILSTFFPSHEARKTFQDLPAGIVGKIGDELDLKSVHSLKATCRRTRAYLEVYSCHKLVPPSQNERAQSLRQRLQNDELLTFLRLLTHMTPLELREDAGTMLATAENNFNYRNAGNPQDQKITQEAFHKQATLLKLVETYSSKAQRQKAKNLFKNHMEDLWQKVNQSQNQQETLFWLNLIGQEGRMNDRIQVHHWCHQHPLYTEAKKGWLKVIEKNAYEGGLLDRLSLSEQYQKGTCGFPKDEEKATYWIMKASDLLAHSSFDQIVDFLTSYALANTSPQKGFFSNLVDKSPQLIQPIRQGTLTYWLEKLENKAQEGSLKDKRDLAYLYGQLKLSKFQKGWEKKLEEQAFQQGLNGMRELASWYQEGHTHLPKDPVKATYWQNEMEKAALNGSLEDKRKMAYWYAEGHYGMPYDIQGTTRKNPKKAEEWFKRVATEGTQEDKLFLALAYGLGKFLNLVGFDPKEAGYWYEEAFKNQPLPLERCQIFIDVLKVGTHKVYDVKEKLDSITNPLQGVGHPHAQYYWALRCMEADNYKEAVEFLEKAKSQGLRDAAYTLGFYYKNIFKENSETRTQGMIDNFTFSAKCGHPLAHRELGWLHENQQGGIRDPLASWAHAIAHYKYAALYGVKSAYERAKNLEHLLKNSIRKRF